MVQPKEDKELKPPVLPPPVEPPERFPGFLREFEQLGIGLYAAQKRVTEAEREKARMEQLGIEHPLSRIWGFRPPRGFLAPAVGGLIREEDYEQQLQLAQQEFDLAFQELNAIRWRQEVMMLAEGFLAMPEYNIQSGEDLLKHIVSEVPLREEDMVWLEHFYDRMKHLTNVLPEGFDGDAIEAQTKILEEILTAPKLELKAVHSLTVDEIAKSFAFGVAELPQGMTKEDVRGLLSYMELAEEETKEAREWLEERAAEWAIESARLNLIRSGAILAEIPGLTPWEFTKLVATQPMMAMIEGLTAFWDVTARPMSAMVIAELPPPVAGALHGILPGAVSGFVGGGVVGAIGGPVGAGAGALIGMGVGIIAGAVAGIFTGTTDKDDISEIYEFYRGMGEGTWTSYAMSFNEWDAPWWKKLALETAFDPTVVVGLGMATAASYKIGAGLTKIGLRKLGTRIGPFVGAWERGYVTGADAIFKAGLYVPRTALKGYFWLTGGIPSLLTGKGLAGFTRAGFAIPRTLHEMSRLFKRKAFMDFKATLERSLPGVRNIKGITAKDVTDRAAINIRQAIERPHTGWDKSVQSGAALLEFNYLDDLAVKKVFKGVVSDLDINIADLAHLNEEIANLFSGQIKPLPLLKVSGERVTAGRMIAILGREATDEMVDTLATRLIAFREEVAKKALDSFTGETAERVMMNAFDRIEAIRLGNLRSPLTPQMFQAGRAASWHSRVTDTVLYHSKVLAVEKRVVNMAHWNLLFANFGPFNFGESMQRSFLGGAEIIYPQAYDIAHTARVFGGIANRDAAVDMYLRGTERRLLEAVIDPKTGRTAIFKEGKIPFITKRLDIPEWVPFWGGKQLNKRIHLYGTEFNFGSLQDIYNSWADMSMKMDIYDQHVHWFKAMQEVAPEESTLIRKAVDKNRPILNQIKSFSKMDANDIDKVIFELSFRGPDQVRMEAALDVLTMERRVISREMGKKLDLSTEVDRVIKERITSDILDGTAIARGIDGYMDDMLEASRELAIIRLKPQIDSIAEEVADMLARPPKNLDDFLGDMQRITSLVDGVDEGISYYRSMVEIRKHRLLPVDRDNFEVGSAKLLAEYMETSEDQLIKIMNNMMKNAKEAGLSDIQLARLTELDNISRLEVENLLATRTKLADLDATIARTPKKSRTSRFWEQNTAQRESIWNEFRKIAGPIKDADLLARSNFLSSVGKPLYSPDFVPEVTAKLTPNHLAYLYGATGDDLYRGLTRMQHHVTIRSRDSFIKLTKLRANTYAQKAGKTAADIGFSDEAIGEVYDQLWRNLGIEPTILTPDHPTVMQLEELRQELVRLHAASKIPDSDIVHWRKYINSVADDVGELPMYKAIPEVAEIPVERRLTFEVGGHITEADLTIAGRQVTGIGEQQYYVNKGGRDFATITVFDRPIGDALTVSEIISPEVALARGDLESILDYLYGVAREKNLRYVDILGLPRHGRLYTRSGLKLVGNDPDYARIFGATPDDLYRIEVPAAKAVPTGTPDWWATKESAMTKARDLHALSYPTYDSATVIDESMRAIFPFWNYQIFRWRYMPRTYMRTPGVMTGIARYMNYSDGGYFPIPFTDLQMNPLRGSVWMGGMRSFYLRDFPEYYDVMPGMEFMDYIARAGFFPGIHVMLPVVMWGASIGKPETAQLAPAFVRTTLSTLRAISPQHIGAILEHIYPDRFRDFNVMLTLGDEGHDADLIWRKIQNKEELTPEENKIWLDAVNRVDGIKGILMQQTGLFRIRPEGFAEIRKEFRLAIEEATGVSVAIQEQIDRMYPVTGKRFSDYFHLDIYQTKLLYEWETYRKWQGVITPLYPASWRMEDIRRVEYYDEVERIYQEARDVGIYEDGELIRPSEIEMNRQWVEGEIGPDQWMSFLGKLTGSLGEAVRILGESPAYRDVPKTFDEMATRLEERGMVTPVQTPDQELLYYYYELSPEYKWSWESQRMELDFDTYYAYIDILLESLDATHRERLLQRIQSEWTPLRKLRWEFSREYGRPYRNIRSIVLREYEPEQIQQIRRFEVAPTAERDELREIIGPEGEKLIAGFQRRVREARQRLRILDPEMDAWLNFFGTTTALLSVESREVYEELRKKYLTKDMIR